MVRAWSSFITVHIYSSKNYEGKRQFLQSIGSVSLCQSEVNNAVISNNEEQILWLFLYCCNRWIVEIYELRIFIQCVVELYQNHLGMMNGK